MNLDGIRIDLFKTVMLNLSGGDCVKEKKKMICMPVIPTQGIDFPMVDPMGSYTGVPVVPLEEPVQDADDL